MTITIVKRGSATAPDAVRIYCGRGSPLGNPHVMKHKSIAERNRVCDMYAAEFPTWEQMKECAWIIDFMRRRPGFNLELECFCAPKRCHCETIRDYLIKQSLTPEGKFNPIDSTNPTHNHPLCHDNTQPV